MLPMIEHRKKVPVRGSLSRAGTPAHPLRPILVVSEEDGVYHLIADCFSLEYTAERASTQGAALRLLERTRYEFVFIDLHLLDPEATDDYEGALRPFKQLYPTLEVIVMSSPSMIRRTVMAVKAGASNYLTYPIDPEEVKYITQSLRHQAVFQSELDYLRGRFWELDTLEVVRTKSKPMRRVFENIRSVAPTKSTVLLIGETGVGKGLMAKIIHRHSNRKDGPFVAVHCGAIPETLLESELFGHEKGSFTGAVKRKLGRFEIAHGGTIFLDEIGTITPGAQVKLLQVLQDGTFTRVGGEQTLQTDARVVAATNMDLKIMAEEGRFRKDLYYRLNVFPISIPPLSDRLDDIPDLANGFLKKLERLYAKGIHTVDPVALEALMHYDWPGNIRELENLIERAYILEGTDTLSAEGFPGELFLHSNHPSPPPDPGTPTPLALFRRHFVEQAERIYLQDSLTRNCGRINETAKQAGITTRQLHKLMTKYGLRKEDFRLKNKE